VLVDPAFLLALENQQRRLRSLLDRIDSVRAQLPSTQAGVWRGPAHTLYAGSVDALASEFGAIRDRLDAALASTRAAHSVAAMQG
jgi:HAMP domain-containing protein